MAVAMVRPKGKATKIAEAILGKPSNIANQKVKKEYKDAHQEGVRTNATYTNR